MGMEEWFSEGKDLKAGIQDISAIFQNDDAKEELIKIFIRSYVFEYKRVKKMVVRYANESSILHVIMGVLGDLPGIIGGIDMPSISRNTKRANANTARSLGRLLGQFFPVVEFGILAKNFGGEERKLEEFRKTIILYTEAIANGLKQKKLLSEQKFIAYRLKRIVIRKAKTEQQRLVGFKIVQLFS